MIERAVRAALRPSVRATFAGLLGCAALAGACASNDGDGERDSMSGGAPAPSAGRPGASAGASGPLGGGGARAGQGGGVGGRDGGAATSGCAGDADCPEGQACNRTTRECEIGGGCGQSQFVLSELPPNMMILLDRSGSMDGDADGDTRWNAAKNAIETLTAAFDARVRFGLATYSACLAGGCSAGTIVVPIAENNAAGINAFLATTVDERSDDGSQQNDDGKLQYLCDSGDPETTTGKSLSALVGEATLLDTTRTNAVVLLTDGEESEECADDCDGPCGARALLEQSPAVKTYVIGLGVNPDAIDAIAAAGDTGQAIGANSQAELSSAFEQVASAVASCDYTLDSAPPDPDELYVFFNDEPTAIAAGAAEGFSYEPATRRLQLNGAACERVTSGEVSDIDVVYGCPQPVVD